VTLNQRSRGIRGIRPSRLAKGVVIAVLAAVGINHMVWAVVQWPMGDLEIYLAAAERLRSGEPLYLVADAFNSYWYSPWFAASMMPLTFLPESVAAVGWSALLLACTAAVGVVLWTERTVAARIVAVMAVPALFAVSAGGNVQALIVLALLVALHRPSGPLWVALAASLKFTPILFVLVFVARREWGRAGISLLLSALLIIPAFLMGFSLDRVQGWQGMAPSVLAFGLPIYVMVVGACCLAALFGPVKYSAVAAATGAVLALPRLFVYDVTLVAIGAVDERRAATPPRASEH